MERLSVETSHPKWILDRWISVKGMSFTDDLARANNQIPPTAFRVVRNRASETKVIEQLRDAGLKVIPSKIVDGAWRIEGGTELVTSLVNEGVIYLQDEASQLVPAVVSPRPHERILDACAAPGSKTTLLAD